MTTSPQPDNDGIRDRIAVLMRERGMTQTTLGGRAGLSKTAMSRLMKGERRITAGELGTIAYALGVPAASLLGEELRSAPKSRPFALAARLSSADAEYPEAQDRARQLLEVRGQLDSLVAADSRDLASVPQLPSRSLRAKDQGARLGTAVREALGLGIAPIDDIAEFAETHFGLAVAREPLPDALVGLLVTDSAEAGATSTEPTQARSVAALALVNSTDTTARQRFTIAHELGHLLFEDADVVLPDYRKAENKKKEWRANEFASELLSPAAGVSALTEQLGATPPPGSQDRAVWVERLVCGVAATYGVSFESAANRCNNLGWLDDAENAQVKRSSATTLLCRHGHRDYVENPSYGENDVEPPASYARDALYAYSEGMVGLGTMAALWRTEDIGALREELAAAGYVPSFA